MLVSLNWLNNYVDIAHLDVEELAEKITKSGIEVDGIEYIGADCNDVVIGYVQSCEQHPNADKLSLCQVDVGDEQSLQIICGAPNVEQGQKVVVAKPGAVLPGDFKIKKVKLRGIESNGMICSLQELGVDEKYIPKEYADGIYVFPEDVQVGERVEPLLNLNDAVLEFDLTPNRGDALSMLGVAYEVAAILDQPIHLPDETVTPIDEQVNQYIRVKVEDPDLTPYYGAFLIKDVQVKPSPLWMQNYLLASGVRPINNVVDITNYVLLEYGQPLHAFDYDRIGTNEIVVRRAKANEKMVTLDDEERVLQEDDLVITNGKEPIALAGVMGGANTEVHDGTTTILLEAAYFDPQSVRKTAQRTGLRSEASIRFEKGVDPNRVERAGLRACQLLQKHASGNVLSGVESFDQLDRSEKVVDVNTSAINNRLGTDITSDEIGEILQRLRFSYERDDDQFRVSIPTRRGDISIFEDMLEEVARIYGYDHLPYTLPVGASQAGSLTEKQRLKREIRRYLQGAGLMETVTYSLTNKPSIDIFISPEIEKMQPKPVHIATPISEDHHYLRLSLLPELLKTLRFNQARNQSNLFYYEMGTIFVNTEQQLTKQPDEWLRVSGALTGKWVDHEWQQEQKQVDFYVVKGIVEGLFRWLQLDIEFTQTSLTHMHPGRCATILYKGKTLGFLGQVHPQLEDKMGITETYVFDINLETVFKQYEKIPTYEKISKYPSMQRDVAFVLNKDVEAGQVQSVIEKSGAPLIKHVHVFDVYEGNRLPEEKKSIAYNLIFQDREKTLKDDEVDEVFQKIVQQVSDQFDAHVRS